MCGGAAEAPVRANESLARSLLTGSPSHNRELQPSRFLLTYIVTSVAKTRVPSHCRQLRTRLLFPVFPDRPARPAGQLPTSRARQLKTGRPYLPHFVQFPGSCLSSRPGFFVFFCRVENRFHPGLAPSSVSCPTNPSEPRVQTFFIRSNTGGSRLILSRRTSRLPMWLQVSADPCVALVEPATVDPPQCSAWSL